MATKTCGLNGSLRDFTTAQALFAWAASQNFTGTPPVFEFYNDGGPIADTAQCNMNGATGLSSGNKMTLQPASGQGFRDSATRATDPLRWNSSTGVALTNNKGYQGGAAYITPGNVIIDGLQFRTTATSNTGCISTGGVGGNTIRNSILEGAGNYPILSIGQGDSTSALINVLILNKGTSTGISVQGGGPVLVDQCTVVRPGTAANVGIATAYGGSVKLRNSIIYGDTTNVTGTFDATSTNNATNKTSFNVANAGGGTPQYNVSTSDFVNTAGASTYDFRPSPSSSKLVGKGASLGYSTDIFNNTRSSPTSIGAAEVGAASGGPTLSTPTTSQTSTTTATIGATTDTASGTMYAIVSTSATPPSQAQIQAGQSSTGAAATYASNAAISSTGAKTFNATGLTTGVTYYAYFQQVDGSSNNSAVLSSSSFTLTAGSTAKSGAVYYYRKGNTNV